MKKEKDIKKINKKQEEETVLLLVNSRGKLLKKWDVVKVG